jgi:2-polyprenyl-3-methyl-5-hydroxy-6-metoxy-1,4-benzoquinol methylase
MKISTSVEFEKIAQCQVCSGLLSPTRIKETIDARTFSLVVCTQCDLGVTTPQPTEETLHHLYERDSSRAANLNARDFDPVRRGGLIDRLKNRMVYKDLRKRILDSRDCHLIVDYSCGNGRYANAARILTGCRVVAVDFHDDQPETLDEEVQYVTHDNFCEKNVDLIILRHVLEHVKSPELLLRELAQHLSENGYIYIEVPNRNSIWSTWLGAKWIQWYMPRHLSHFNKKSLSYLLEASGLDGQIEFVNMPIAGSQLAKLVGVENYSLFWKLSGILLHPLQIGAEKFARSSGCLFVRAGIKKDEV